MEMQDDRTPEQKKTHQRLVIATDTFMSGWGGAKGGKSYAVWACETDHQWDRLEAWVRSRGEMKRVRTTYGAYRPSGRGHCHIYVVDDNHPALGDAQ